MFTALILACNFNSQDCSTFMYPDILPTEEVCMQVLAGGIMHVESQGLYVVDYLCYNWPQKT